MFRTFAVAATLVLAASAAQAEDSSVTTRIHDAAVKVCAAKVGATLPLTFYGAMNANCVDRVTADAMATIRARQLAKADTAAN